MGFVIEGEWYISVIESACGMKVILTDCVNHGSCASAMFVPTGKRLNIPIPLRDITWIDAIKCAQCKCQQSGPVCLRFIFPIFCLAH